MLADEPTGNLATHTGLAILDLMLNCPRRPSRGIAFIITTHASHASHASHISDAVCDISDAVCDISDGMLTPG